MICPICRGRYLASQEHICKYETALLTPADFGSRVDFGEGKIIAELKAVIAEKDKEIERLKVELDKLRSGVIQELWGKFLEEQALAELEAKNV